MTKYFTMTVAVLLLFAGGVLPNNVYGYAATATPTPNSLEIGQTVYGTIQGKADKKYTLTLTNEKGSPGSDVVVLFNSNHAVTARDNCSSYLITMENGTTKSDSNCRGGSSDEDFPAMPTSDDWFFPAHELQPHEQSYRRTETFTVERLSPGVVQYSFKVFALAPQPISAAETVEGTFTNANPFRVYRVSTDFAQDIITAYLEDASPRGNFLWTRVGPLKWMRSGDWAPVRKQLFGQGIYTLELQLANDNTYHLLIGGVGPYRLRLNHKSVQTATLGSYDVALTYQNPTDIRVLNGRKDDEYTISATGKQLCVNVHEDHNPLDPSARDDLAYFNAAPTRAHTESKDITFINNEPIYIETSLPDGANREEVHVSITITSGHHSIWVPEDTVANCQP